MVDTDWRQEVCQSSRPLHNQVTDHAPGDQDECVHGVGDCSVGVGEV